MQAMMMGAHHQHHQHHGGGDPADGGDEDGDADDASSTSSSSSSSNSSSSAGAGGGEGAGVADGWAAGDGLDEDEGPADERGAIARAKESGVLGRLEPGVLALAVDGPLVATCNTLGGPLDRLGNGAAVAGPQPCRRASCPPRRSFWALPLRVLPGFILHPLDFRAQGARW
jgi:hypothetical protein